VLNTTEFHILWVENFLKTAHICNWLCTNATAGFTSQRFIIYTVFLTYRKTTTGVVD